MLWQLSCRLCVVPALVSSGEALSVGDYIAGSLPTGLNAYEMFAQPRKAYVLMGVEPELDCQNPQLAVAALKQAALTIMLTPFKHQAALDYADVLLPVAPFSETSGTYINTEGRTDIQWCLPTNG